MADPVIPTEALEAAARAIRAIWPQDVSCQPCAPCTEAFIRAAAPHLIAEGRRQAAADIRSRSSEIAARAESMAGAETGAADSHPFTLGCVWAAAIAEGTNHVG